MNQRQLEQAIEDTIHADRAEAAYAAGAFHLSQAMEDWYEAQWRDWALLDSVPVGPPPEPRAEYEPDEWEGTIDVDADFL